MVKWHYWKERKEKKKTKTITRRVNQLPFEGKRWMVKGAVQNSPTFRTARKGLSRKRYNQSWCTKFQTLMSRSATENSNCRLRSTLLGLANLNYYRAALLKLADGDGVRNFRRHITDSRRRKRGHSCLVNSSSHDLIDFKSIWLIRRGEIGPADKESSQIPRLITA